MTNQWYSVSVFWFKLCSRRLTERNAAILSAYNIYYIKMNRDKPCHNSFCEPAATERRSKKAHGLHRCTRSLWHGFFDLCFLIYIWISYGFASVTACGCWEEWRNEVRRPKGKSMKNCRLRWLRNKVRRPEGKPIIQFRVYCPKESKCPRTCKIRLKSPLSCQGSIKRKSKYKSKENQKTNPWKDSVASVIIRERFLI